jgi:ABC-type polysaccharide/polyol phosphate export permease
MPASNEIAHGFPPIGPEEASARLTTVRPSAGIDWRGLVWTLVRTDFKARYHGSASGFLWALLKPTAMFAVLVGVFSFVFRDGTYKLDLVIGLFLWDFFADATKTGMIALSAKSFMLTKASFPRWIVVVTSMANPLLTLLVFACVMTGFLAIGGRAPSPAALAAFAGYIAALTAIALGISLGSSVLFLRYRDLNQVWDMATTAGFFIAPIIYPLGVIPEQFHLWLYLWPPTPVIEFSRAALVDGTLPTARAHACLLLLAAGLLACGALLFRRLAPRSAELV